MYYTPLMHNTPSICHHIIFGPNGHVRHHSLTTLRHKGLNHSDSAQKLDVSQVFGSFTGIVGVELELIVCDARLHRRQCSVKMSAGNACRYVAGMNAFWQTTHCSLVHNGRHLQTSSASSSSSPPNLPPPHHHQHHHHPIFLLLSIISIITITI